MEESRKKGRALLDELLSHVTDESVHGEVSTGAAVGREVLPPYVDMQEQVVAWLREHAERHDLKQRALESCRKYLQAMLTDESEAEETTRGLRGLALDQVKLRFVKHYLIFEDTERSWTRVMSQVTFGEHDEHCWGEVNVFGYYTLETLLDGTINDDWFSWEPPPRDWPFKDEG